MLKSLGCGDFEVCGVCGARERCCFDSFIDQSRVLKEVGARKGVCFLLSLFTFALVLPTLGDGCEILPPVLGACSHMCDGFASHMLMLTCCVVNYLFIPGVWLFLKPGFQFSYIPYCCFVVFMFSFHQPSFDHETFTFS